MSDSRFEVIDGDHRISVVANNLSENAMMIAAQAGLSRWELCVALANAIGHILADAGGLPQPPDGITMPTRGKPLPRPDAMERIGALGKVMRGAYDLRDVEGQS